MAATPPKPNADSPERGSADAKQPQPTTAVPVRHAAPPKIAQRHANIERRDITSRTLAVRAGSYNATERSFEAVAATETPAEVFDWQRFEYIREILVADGCEAPERVPLLDSHNRYRAADVIGTARDWRREGTNWISRNFFVADDPEVERVAVRVRDGHITDVSIGYEVLRYVDIPAGSSQEIEGREYRAGDQPLRVTTKWRIRELSVCPIGADENAKIRDDAPPRDHSQGRQPSRISRRRSMNPRLYKYLRSLGLAADATDEAAREFMVRLRGVERSIANLLDYDEADASARTAADQMIRSAGFDPENPTQVLRSSSRRGQRAEDDEEEREDEDEEERNFGEEDEDEEERPAPRRRNRRPRDERAEGARLERERVAALREMAGTVVPADILQRAIDEGWSTQRAGRAFLQAIRDSRGEPLSGDAPIGAPAVHSRASRTGFTVDQLAGALLHRSGLDPTRALVRTDAEGRIRREPNEQVRQRVAEESWQYAGLSSRDIMRMALRCDGIQVREAASVAEMFRAYSERAGFSTNTLAQIYTTNVSAQLLDSYEQTPDSTTGGWVREAEVPNFLTNERPRIEKGPSLKKLPRQKEADHAEFTDAVETYKIARYARQFSIDEQDIVDERFGELMQLAPREFGQAAARLRPDMVYAVIMANAAMRDGTALFHANHGNLQTSAALSVPTLAACVAAIRKQTENGVNLNLMPKFLIVPAALEVTALELSSSPLLITGSDTIRPAMNALASQGYQVVVDSRLDNGVIDPATGTTHAGSGTTWFMAVSAAQAPTIEVGYLAGTGRAPQVRMQPHPVGRWGFAWDVKLDIGAKSLDWRGLSKNTA